MFRMAVLLCCKESTQVLIKFIKFTVEKSLINVYPKASNFNFARYVIHFPGEN